jgi:hypothetical protein
MAGLPDPLIAWHLARFIRECPLAYRLIRSSSAEDGLPAYRFITPSGRGASAVVY